MERVITIKAVNTKSGQSQKGPWTMALVNDENGQVYQTFDNGYRELAEGNLEATARVVFTQQTRGNFTNNVIDKLTIEPTAQTAVNGTVSPSNGTVTYNGTDDRQIKIMRQSAAKVAAELLKLEKPEDQTFDTFQNITERLVSYFDNGLEEQVSIPFGE